MAIISYGRLDKKLILILLFTILREVYTIIMDNAPDDYHYFRLDALSEDLGYALAGIIMYLIFKKKKNPKEKDKRSFKYLIILFCLIAVKSCYEHVYHYAIHYNQNYVYYRILNAVNGIEIILMSVATFLIFKYKYYLHHIITMIIYCILGFSIDIILGNFKDISYDYVYFFIIFIISEVLIYCHIKYMMDKIYYHYTEVLLYYGIFSVIIKILIYSGYIIYEYENNIEDMLPRLKTYFTETNIWVIIFFQFLYMIIDGFIYCILLVQILYYLRPNYLIIDDEITNYSGDLFGDNENRFYTLIPFLLQIFLMLFYFEILEFNYCDLNKNTAKNIEIREENESKDRDSDASIIELNSQYILNEDKMKINDERENDEN